MQTIIKSGCAPEMNLFDPQEAQEWAAYRAEAFGESGTPEGQFVAAVRRIFGEEARLIDIDIEQTTLEN